MTPVTANTHLEVTVYVPGTLLSSLHKNPLRFILLLAPFSDEVTEARKQSPLSCML